MHDDISHVGANSLGFAIHYQDNRKSVFFIEKIQPLMYTQPYLDTSILLFYHPSLRDCED